MTKLFKKTLLFFLSLFIFSVILPQSTHAQQYVVKPYLVVPSDWNTPKQQVLIPAQQQDILQALKEAQAWFARTVNGKTFNLDENVRVIFDEDSVGERRLVNRDDISNLLPNLEEGVVNITWVVGLWSGRSYGRAGDKRYLTKGEAFLSYDALLDLRSERFRNFSLKATAHELGHAFDLVNAGYALWHPCTQASENECTSNAPRPYPGVNEWNGSVMGQASRDLTAGLNNSAHNPELWKIYKSPFINPQRDPPPEPSPLPPPPTTQITSIFPNPVEVGQILTVKGAGFGDAAGSFEFLRENGSFTEARQILEWTDKFIRVTVDESAVGASFMAIRPKPLPEGEPAVIAKISIIRSEPLPYLTINYSADCGDSHQPMVGAQLVLEQVGEAGSLIVNYTNGAGLGSMHLSLRDRKPGTYILRATPVDGIQPEPAFDSVIIDEGRIQRGVNWQQLFHYPQCPVQTTAPTLSYRCSPPNLVTSWNVGSGQCEASIVAGTTFNPISESCSTHVVDLMTNIKTGQRIPIVNGGIYQLAIKRDGKIVATSERVTVQCAIGSPSPIPSPIATPAATLTPISGPGVCPNPNLKPENTPAGYKWEADCSASCTENENCGTGATGQVNWCYGFEGGARCLRLESAANQSPAFTTTPQQSATASCENEVLDIAKGRGAPDNRLNDIASDVCGRGTLDLFKKGCDKGVIYGEVPGTQCEGQQSQPAPGTPQKRIVSITVNSQSLALDGSSGAGFSLPGKIGQAQLFSAPVVVQYSDGSSKLFYIKFNYLKGQQGAPSTPGAPGKCDPSFVPATPPSGYKWKTDCNTSCSDNSSCGEYEPGKQNWCYGFTDGAKCIRLEKESGGGGSGGGGSSDPCKTEVKSIAKSRNAPDSRLDDIANDVCGRGTLDLFKKGCDKGVIYGEVPGADCGAGSTSGSSPAAAQPVKDTSKEDCGTRGGNHCSDGPNNVPPASRECQNLGATFDCVGGCFKCK